MTPSPSSFQYAHVFLEGQPREHWRKLNANETFSILLAKFWGKDIREEKRNWQETQPGGHQMDTDTDEAVANFVLSFDIVNLNVSRMWVREDYVVLYDDCTVHFAKAELDEMPQPPSVVITGQPGIGKSYWIFYAVRRRLGEKKPFIWYFDDQWYLFVEDGVFLCPEKFSTTSFRRVGLWVLADADNAVHGVPAELAQMESKVHTIFTSSPPEERWKVLLKTTLCLQLVMNPWSWDEIYQAAIIRRFTSEKIDAARRAFEDLGPTARFCIDFVQNPRRLASYKAYRERAIKKLSIDQLVKAVEDSSDLKFEVSHSLFLVRRVKDLQPADEGYLVRYNVEPITSYVKHELKFKLMEAEHEARLRIYKLFETVPESRRVAGIAFESMAQLRFQKDVTVTLVPMVRHLPTGKKRLTVWKSQFVDESVPMSTEDSGSAAAMAAIAARETLSIRFKPDEIIQYQKPKLGPVRSGIFYVPRASNQEAFDSFIVDNGVLYIFQITIADWHTIKGGLLDFYSQQSLQTILQGKEWCFIFVIPPGGVIECPESSDDRLKKEFWNKVKLFSAEFDPKKEGGSPGSGSG